MTIELERCELCGEPMPENEQMFKIHGYSGPCPKPPLPRANDADALGQAWLAEKLKDPEWVAKIKSRSDEANRQMRERGLLT